MLRFIIAQIFGLIALALICSSYYFNNKKTFVMLHMFGNIFYASSFLVLNVYVGGITTMISLLRCIALFVYETKQKEPPLYLFIIFVVAYLTTGILLYQTHYDIIVIISFQMFNLAMFIKNIRIVRFIMLPPNLMVIAYNIICYTYTNAILDCVESLVLIISIVTYEIIGKLKNKNDDSFYKIMKVVKDKI